MENGWSRAAVSPAEGERFTSLRRALGVTAFGMNLIALAPGERGRIHRHRLQEEVYVVLEGTLDLVLEGATEELAAGQAARVGPEVRRQLVNRGPGRVVLLALGGAGEHVGRDGEAYAGWDAQAPVPPSDLPLPGDLPAGELRSA